MEETEIQSSEQQDPPIVEGPGGADSTIDSEMDALLRHAEALTEVITSNTSGPLEDYLEQIADKGPITAQPRPPVVERPPPVIPRRTEPTASVIVPRQSPAEPSDPESTLADEPSSEAAPADIESNAYDEIEIDAPPIETSDIDAALSSDATIDAESPTDEQTAEIDAILQEACNAPPITDRIEDVPRDLPDLLNDPDDLVESDSDAAGVDAPAEPSVEVLYIPDEDVAEDAHDADAAGPESDVEPPQPVINPPPEPADTAAEPVDDTAESTADVAQESPTEPKPSLAAKIVSLFGKGVATSRSAIQFVMRIPATVIAGIGYVLEILNKPFSRTSNRTRDIIGIVGIATMICGILAWVLPWLLTSNPFLNIPTGIVTGH
ncbi:MAG: hypothetical protein H6819_11120 [Phycisphaerales bacterium]|nr:hypothetical protein [Phycisphaerales bacterium]MCB9855884.1 hypothetical protein [Phycisphaerales bacterium]